jgi:hypothetical protein
MDHRKQHKETKSQANQKDRFKSHLKIYKRLMSASDVRKKWRSIPQTAQEQLRELLRTSRRAVLAVHSNKRSNSEEIDSVLSTSINRLERALLDTYYPPKTKDIHFNLDLLKQYNVRFLRVYDCNC